MERITKKSYIKGVLRELDILGSDLTYRSDTCTSRVNIQLITDFAKSDQEEFEILNLELNDEIAELLFEIDDNIYKTKIIKGKVGFLIPDIIELCDLRESKRIKKEVFYDDTIFVEIRAVGKKVYGELINVGSNNILVKTKDKSFCLDKQMSVELKGYIKTGKVIEYNGEITSVRETESSISYLINFKTEKKQINRIQKRFPIKDTITLDAVWPNDESFRISFELIDFGYLGFKGSIKYNKDFPPLGSILNIPQLSINAHIKWREGNVFGCDLSCNDTEKLGKWHELVEDKTSGSFGNFTNGERNKKILNIFLRSGYLRKHKAYVFSKTPKIHEIIPSDPSLGAWIQRYGIATNENNIIDTHISFLKLTNTSWIIQEASSMSLEKGIGVNLVLNNLEKFYYRNQVDFDLSSSIFALYDATMKFNLSFWDQLDNNEYVQSYDTCVLDISDLSQFKESEDSVELTKLSLVNWREEYNALSECFSARLLNAFGLSNFTWMCPFLEASMKNTHHLLSRKVHVVKLNNKNVGVAVQFGLPTIANVTSTANHLWVLIDDRFDDFYSIVEGLITKESNGINLSGVTEVVVVKKKIKGFEFSPPFTRFFKLKLLDCYRLIDTINVLRESK